jgi:hypothetical protein
MNDAPTADANRITGEGSAYYTEVSIAHVTAWEPSRRVVFRWEIGAGFTPDRTQASELEVRFVSLGEGATRVELEHRDFDRISADGEAYRDGLNQGWPVALDQFAMACRRETSSPPTK